MAEGRAGNQPVEIPLRGKYRAGFKGSQRSRAENNPNHKRNKAKGEVLAAARAVTEANRRTLVLDGGRKLRWE